MWNWLLPFRYRFWVVSDLADDTLTVIRSRLNPQRTILWCCLLDGPFDSTDETARSLAFWSRQIWPECFEDYDYDDCETEDEEELD